MLEGLRSYFLNRDEPYRSVHGNVEQCVRVESVDLDVSGEDHEIVILMRDLKRPECVFGRRQPAVEPGDFEETLRHFDSLRDAAEICVTISWAGIEGDIQAIGYGLPKECTPGVINWF